MKMTPTKVKEMLSWALADRLSLSLNDDLDNDDKIAVPNAIWYGTGLKNTLKVFTNPVGAITMNYLLRDVPDDLWRKFKATCALRGESVAKTLRILIRDYVKKESTSQNP